MRYPRSFSRLLLAGFTLVALPLVVALITSAIAVDALASRSQAAVYQAVQATQTSRRLGELLTALERSARQIEILNDRSLLDTYRSTRMSFAQAAQEFARQSSDQEQNQNLQSIVAIEKQIFDLLSDPGVRAPALRTPVGRFGELADRARSIGIRSVELIDREVESMRRAAADTRSVMLWQGLSLVPVVIFLVSGFTLLIARPIRQLDTAIRDLGNGQMHKPITINGPEDLEYLGERLEWMRRQFINAEQEKNTFLQQVAHELKTPLTALREGAQLLSDDVVGRLNEEQREIARILLQSSTALQGRIEELLDYGAIEFYRQKLKLESVSALRLFNEVAERHTVAMQARGISLQGSMHDIALTADTEKLRTVFDNLLSNAIRFSPPGGAVTVNMVKDRQWLTVDVMDEGPGIAPADQPHIFDAFYQGRIQGSGPVKGTGLGLSIVRQYVLAHGGSVSVTGADARGAHFRVQLPLTGGEVA